MTTTDAVHRIATHEELLAALDAIVARSARGDRTAPEAEDFWAELLTREGHPLATDLPDAALLRWHADGLLGDLGGARVLDVGCGAGRNAGWFARQGAEVTGLDLAAHRFSPPDGVTLLTCDVLHDGLPRGPFDLVLDLVLDSGCYHHVAPHRRPTYRERVLPLVGRRYAIVAFDATVMPQPDDADVLFTGDQAGGLSFTVDDLVRAAAPLRLLDAGPMPATANGFGDERLQAALFAR